MNTYRDYTDLGQKIVFYTFLIIGILFLGFGIGFALYTSFFQSKVTLTGTVIEAEKSSHLLIQYVVNGETLTSKTAYTSIYSIGDSVPIYYLASDPSKIYVTDMNLTIILTYSILGVIFLAISIIYKMILVTKEKQIQKLIETNHYIPAEIKEIKVQRTNNVLGNYPYRIIASYTVNGKEYKFRSKEIWFDPDPILKEKDQNSINVFYEGNDFRPYYVDIRFLKNLYISSKGEINHEIKGN